MCWNEWPSLTHPPLPHLPDSVEVCKNCERGIKKVLSFSRFHGIDLVSGELAPQAGSKTPEDPYPALTKAAQEAEEPSPTPSRKASKAT